MLLLTTLLALVPACFAGTAGSIGTMLLLTMLLALIPACFDGTADSMAQCCCWHSSQLLHPFIYCGASSWSFVLEMALEKQNPRCKANPGTPGTKNNFFSCLKRFWAFNWNRFLDMQDGEICATCHRVTKNAKVLTLQALQLWNSWVFCRD